MFVGIAAVEPDNINVNSDHWADNSRSIAHAIRYQAGNFRVLVDGTDKSNAGTISIAQHVGVALVAKDKSTLLKGLRVVKPGLKLASTDGSLGFVTGSYDREKVGAWIRTKIQSKQQTGNFNSFDRLRLDDRAYYVIVAGTATLVNNHKAVHLHETEVQVNALPALISGKMTREEAVDNLMQDLLIT